jgi:hypothetical protein
VIFTIQTLSPFALIYGHFQGEKMSFPVRHYIHLYKGKVKCTLVQALRLCGGRTAYRGSRGIDLTLLDHGTKRG